MLSRFSSINLLFLFLELFLLLFDFPNTLFLLRSAKKSLKPLVRLAALSVRIDCLFIVLHVCVILSFFSFVLMLKMALLLF